MLPLARVELWQDMTALRQILSALALVLAVVGTGLWLWLGAHCGWTKTSVPVTTRDEITGIEAITYRSQFVPGLDFLGGALLGAGLLAGASLFIRKSSLNLK